MGLKVSEVIKMLEQVLDTAGDVELKVDDGYVLAECRDIYLDFQEHRTNQFVILSKHVIGWDKNKANHYYLGNKNNTIHPNNKFNNRRKQFTGSSRRGAL